MITKLKFQCNSMVYGKKYPFVTSSGQFNDNSSLLQYDEERGDQLPFYKHLKGMLKLLFCFLKYTCYDSHTWSNNNYDQHKFHQPIFKVTASPVAMETTAMLNLRAHVARHFPPLSEIIFLWDFACKYVNSLVTHQKSYRAKK